MWWYIEYTNSQKQKVRRSYQKVRHMGLGSYCYIDREFLLGMMKRSRNAWWWQWYTVNTNTNNSTLKMPETLKFMLCTCCHNKNVSKGRNSSDLHSSIHQAATATLMCRNTGHPSGYHCMTPHSHHSARNSFYLWGQGSSQNNWAQWFMLYKPHCIRHLLGWARNRWALRDNLWPCPLSWEKWG